MGSDERDSRDSQIEGLQRRLEESETRLSEIQSLARMGSWEWKLPEMSSTWSKELLRIFGRDPGGGPPSIDELIAAVHPEDRRGFQDLVERVRRTRGPFRYSYRIVRANGEVRYLQALGHTEMGTDGKPRRSYGTTQDITELKRSEARLEQAQRLEALGRLAGGIAHDFNNQLAVILNFTEDLLPQVDDGEASTHLREIERAANSAAELVRQLLLFSRREAPDLAPVDLAAAIRDAEALLRRTIGENIELTVDAPPGLPFTCLGAGQAEQVLVNLVVNARDAMPKGGRIAVTVRAVGGDKLDESHRLVLAVKDDGFGMPEDVIAQAFDPFFTTKPRGRGAGFGLATVYGIASQAGGRVEIDSRPGQGTEVRVYLPLSDGDAGPEEVPGLPPLGHGESQGILVVDNEKAVRTILCWMLEKHGYVAHSAAGGLEAEAMLDTGDCRVDLLLTDLRMPGMSGTQLVQRLRGRHPQLPTIFMSGFAGDVGSELGAGVRAVTILEKPFTATELLRAVGDALADR